MQHICRPFKNNNTDLINVHRKIVEVVSSNRRKMVWHMSNAYQ
jgi:hypothetical protein